MTTALVTTVDIGEAEQQLCISDHASVAHVTQVHTPLLELKGIVN